MARKKTGRLIHWGCWNYPGTAICTACRAGLTKTRYRRLWPEKKGTAQEYIAAYDADPMTHCETCRKKAVWYDREKGKVSRRGKRSALQPKSWQRSKWTGKRQMGQALLPRHGNLAAHWMAGRTVAPTCCVSCKRFRCPKVRSR